MGAAESSNWLLTPRLARAWFTQAGAGRPELILPFLRPSWLSRSVDGMNSGLAEPTCAGMLHKSLVTSLGLIPLTPSTQKTSCRKPAGRRGSLCQLEIPRTRWWGDECPFENVLFYYLRELQWDYLRLLSNLELLALGERNLIPQGWDCEHLPQCEHRSQESAAGHRPMWLLRSRSDITDTVNQRLNALFFQSFETKLDHGKWDVLVQF